ncbi:MAG: phosphoglucosamine mutase [Bacteroidetes bacterium]|nr:phosphoglucosamine mutase [Bacteroidota bacterium]
MALIASISGIRGTLGGKSGDNLTPVDIVRFTAAYGTWVKQQNYTSRTIVIGRDARTSGPLVQQLVTATLCALGFEVIDGGLITTPTVEMAVTHLEAAGGIVITASHNPAEWNALKLLSRYGEFLLPGQAAAVLDLYHSGECSWVPVSQLGQERNHNGLLDIHLDYILGLELVNVEAIRAADFHVAIDAVNSVGGIALPRLLEKLGVTRVSGLYCTPNGDFPHNPEPLREHLGDICSYVVRQGAHVGFVVDPDVDRLAIIDEKGELIGEEYTLVAVADYVLRHHPGPTVSNLSSSRALRDLSRQYGQPYTAAAVGEVNVVTEMKRTGAVIGGEGNGGVILPGLHYGRDALVGIALFLSHLATSGQTVSRLRAALPEYHMAKLKADLPVGVDLEALMNAVAAQYPQAEINRIDGVKLDLPQGWIHLRKSNTEPIVRIYSEAASPGEAQALAQGCKDLLLAAVRVSS